MTVTLPPKLYQLADKLAKEEGRTRSELFREALRTYVWERKWRRLQAYGTKRAKELGIKEEDIERLIDEDRISALDENKPHVTEPPATRDHAPSATVAQENVARQVFWDYDIDIEKLKLLLKDERLEKRIWAVGRLLKFARWEDIRRLLSLKQIEEALPKADLPPDRRSMLERALEVWRHGP